MVAVSTSYEVIVTREDGAWLADVPAVAGAHTFARTLTGLRRAVREVVIVMDDLPDDAAVAMSFRFDVDDETVAVAARLGQERRAIAAREAELVAGTARSVGDLIEHGYSVRDAAELLSITAGRVSQLANR